MLGLLMAISILISMGGPQLRAMSSGSKLPTCWVVYDVDSPWIQHLKRKVPAELPVKIVAANTMPRRGDYITYPSGDGALELYTRNVRHPYLILRFPGTQPNVMWPHTSWFWKETVAFVGQQPAMEHYYVPISRTRSSVQSTTDVLRQTSLSDLMTIETVGSLLLFGVQLFCCVHLLISFTSQERERGTLLALALTPATPGQILLSKCLFHGGLALTMSGLIVGILHPQALLEPLLWGTLLASTGGFLSVGVLIASLARTQAAAALLTLCYLLTVALIAHLSKGWLAFAIIRELMFEHSTFILAHASLQGANSAAVWMRLVALSAVVCGWIIVAAQVFRRRGWRG
jgi:hypothetical protein